MARNKSEQEPAAEGVADEVAEVIRVDARVGLWTSDEGDVKFSGLSDESQRAYHNWHHDEKWAFYQHYKAWSEAQST